MSDQRSLDGKTLREEVNELFGVRWDTFVEWTVISWLSLWFWFSLFQREGTGSLGGATDGPLTGLKDFLRTLDVDPPSWLTSTIDWLLEPSRAWLPAVLVVIAVVSCVTAVRSYRLSGLRTLALLSAGVACEIQQDLWPVAWILLLAAIPATVAWVIGFTDGHRQNSRFSEYQYYFAPVVASNYVTRIVLLFFAPVFAPLLLAGQLVVSFRTDLPYDPAQELNSEVIGELKARGDTKADELDALTSMAGAAAVHLAGNSSADARRIADAYRLELKQRRKEMERHALAEAGNRERTRFGGY